MNNLWKPIASHIFFSVLIRQQTHGLGSATNLCQWLLVFRCYELNCVPLNVSVEVLTPSTKNVMLFGDSVFIEVIR